MGQETCQMDPACYMPPQSTGLTGNPNRQLTHLWPEMGREESMKGGLTQRQKCVLIPSMGRGPKEGPHWIDWSAFLGDMRRG